MVQSMIHRIAQLQGRAALLQQQPQLQQLQLPQRMQPEDDSESAPEPESEVDDRYMDDLGE